MAAEQTGKDVCYRPMTDDNVCSREQIALTDFSFRLGSYSYSSETGTDDEDNTRHEAELLMSLCASPPAKTTAKIDAELEAVSSSSSSSSESSFPSSLEDSSHASRRESFSFICPSLSLETTASISSTTSSSLAATGVDESPCCSPQRSVSSIPSVSSVDSDGLAMTPSVLFGRPLTVDDRDALRLSADAMARNVLHSFQKAINWRIRTWVKSLCWTLVRKEKSMLGQGASEEELKTLLDTPEAQLVAALHGIANQIQVSGAGTSFQVLPQRVEETKDAEPAFKKQRTNDETTQKAKLLEEEGDYQYTVAHALVFECVVNLLTPAGYSEVTLEVPGTIEGTFTSAGYDMDNMTSVLVDLDTCMLAAMVEKACRKIIRASVESAMEPPEPSPTSTDSPEIDTQCEDTTSIPPTTATIEDGLGLLTPPPRQVSADITAETVRAALITPREQIISSRDYSSSRRVLRPIPDDLEERGPRRISPQPNSPELISGGSGTATSAFPFTLQTPKVKDLWASASTTSALVSPPLKEPAYHEVPDNGPSLPMLVEVACRAFRGGA